MNLTPTTKYVDEHGEPLDVGSVVQQVVSYTCGYEHGKDSDRYAEAVKSVEHVRKLLSGGPTGGYTMQDLINCEQYRDLVGENPMPANGEWKARGNVRAEDWHPRCRCGGHLICNIDRGVVTKLVEADGDWDDNLGRAVAFGPSITVAFKEPSGDTLYEEEFAGMDTRTGYWDDEEFEFEGIELAITNENKEH